MTAAHRWIAVGALACLLAGCAALTPTLTPPAPAPADSPVPLPPAPESGAGVAVVTAPADGAGRRTVGVVPADSLPSPEALRVLASLPEPIAAADRPSAPPVAPAFFAKPDSALADSSARVVSATAVPTPAPTEPLGDRAGSLERMLTPDSTAPPPPAAAAPVDSARRSAARHPALAGPCFRLQVGAPREAGKAALLGRAASSQLEIEFEVVTYHGLHKVRSRDCLSRETVDHLRKRALAAGFRGVFAVAEPAK